MTLNTEGPPTDDWRASPSRTPRRHELKCWPPYFAAILSGEKRFEVRRDDRGFRAGDTLHLREYVAADGSYTGRTVDVEVTYLLGGSFTGLERGFVVMSIAPVATASEPAADDDGACLSCGETTCACPAVLS